MQLAPLAATRQRLVGLCLATLLGGSWLSLHLYTVLLAAPLPDGPAGLLTVVLLVALQCWLNVGLFIIAHDCMHGSLAPGWPRLNTSVGSVCLALYAGFSYRRLYPKHHEHHALPGSAADPDFSVDHARSPLRWFATFIGRYFGLREFIILSIALSVYLLVLSVPVERLLLFWGLPALLSAWQLFYFGTYLPHHPGVTPFVDQHKARSNDFGHLLSLLSCFHFGYHHEHHLAPGIPWWRLPELRDRRRSASGSAP
ncbi:MAG: fatty acid desaturase [Gammaproteobacteria bacterium]|nr:fatty acid desaturase [Gammaproteobacteria bacterium]